MPNRTNIIYKIFIILIVVSSCLLYFRTRLEQLASPEDYIRSCTDFGQYLLEVQEYTQGTNIIDLMKVAEEPGFFINASSFARITNMSEKSVVSLFSMVMYCIIGLVVSILAIKIGNKKNYNYGIGLVAVLIYVSLYGNINSQVAGIWRQMLGQLYILLLIMISFYGNNKKTQLVAGLFVGMSFISHTFSTIIVGGSYILLIGYAFFQKNNKKIYKKHAIVLLIGILITLPYLYYVFRGYIYDYAVYLFKYIFGFSVIGTGEFYGESDYTKYTGEKYTGWNFYGSDPDSTLPILFYFINFSYILLIFVANLKFFYIFRKNDLYKIFFLILLMYVSLKIDFSTRALLTFELVILPIISVLIFNFSGGTVFRILQIFGIFLVGFLGVSTGIINKTFSTNILSDTSISFVKNNYSNIDGVYFMAGTCSSDMMAQLGINSALNYHLNLKNARNEMAEGKLDFTKVLGLTSSNMLLLERTAVLFDLFKDKDVYIVFTKSDWRELPVLDSGKHKFLNKSYLHLIYSNKSKSAFVKYIFHIKKDDIVYTDTLNYIYTNKKLEDDLNQ